MTKSLSDFWRTRRSYDKSIEMKTILEDLKAFIEMASDEEDFDVRWGEASHHKSGSEKKVVLSYTPIADIATPFSGEAVDVIAGFAAHEAGHRIRDQHGQSVRHLDDSERPDGMTSSIEYLIRNILEDAYIDHYLFVSKAPVLGTYIKYGRKWDMAQPQYNIDIDELKLKAGSEVLSKLDILSLWIKYELYGFNSAEELKDFPDSVLETLLNLAQITDTYCKKKGLVDAVSMYESVWGQIKGYGHPSTQPQDDGKDSRNNGGTQQVDFGKKPDSDNDKGSGDQEESQEDRGAPSETFVEGDCPNCNPQTDTDDSESLEIDKLYNDALPCQNKKYQEIPEGLKQSVEAAIVRDREDITKDVIEEFSEEGFFDSLGDQTHSNIIVERATSIVLPDQDDEVSRSIRQIFNFRKRRKTRYSRRTEEGTISQTRLYRAGIGSSHLYEKRDIKDNLDINVCILCDMSSSVITSQEILGQCVSSLSLALSRRRGVKVCSLAYNSAGISDMNVNIYRLFRTGDKEVAFTKASGGTPSVAAMGAVPGLIRKLLRKANDNLLIHITDGFPHDEKMLGTDIEDLIEVLSKKHKIDTYCLAIVSSPGEYGDQDKLLKKAYGDSYQRLSNYNDLPEALRKLLYNLLVTS